MYWENLLLNFNILLGLTFKESVKIQVTKINKNILFPNVFFLKNNF